MSSDPEIKKIAVSTFSASFREYTGELLELEGMQMLLEILPFIMEDLIERGREENHLHHPLLKNSHQNLMKYKNTCISIVFKNQLNRNNL